MSIWRRAWLSLKGAPVQSLLLACMALLVAFTWNFTWTIGMLTQQIQEQTFQRYRATVSLAAVEALPQELIARCSQLPHVLDYGCVVLQEQAQPVNFSNYVEALGEGESGEVDLRGCLRVEGDELFVTGQGELVAGTFPTEEAPGAVISQDLAAYNGLEVGDPLTVRWLGRELSFPVCGVYQLRAPLTESELSPTGMEIQTLAERSRIFLSQESLLAAGVELPPCNFVTFYLEDPRDVPSVLESMEAQLPPGVTAQESTDILSKSLYQGMQSTYRAFCLLLGCLLALAVFLLVVLLFYRRALSQKEQMLLRVLGFSRQETAWQFALQISYLCFPGLLVACVVFALEGGAFQNWWMGRLFAPQQEGIFQADFTQLQQGLDLSKAAVPAWWYLVWLAVFFAGILLLARGVGRAKPRKKWR